MGDEYDDALRSALVAVLNEMSDQKESSDWALAGSQEVERVRVKVSGRLLLIESETYIGLSIKGDTSLVQEVAKQVAERLKTRLHP